MPAASHAAGAAVLADALWRCVVALARGGGDGFDVGHVERLLVQRTGDRADVIGRAAAARAHDRRAQSARAPRVVAHDLGRAAIDRLAVYQFGDTGVALGDQREVGPGLVHGIDHALDLVRAVAAVAADRCQA